MKSKLQDMYIFARSYIFSTSPALCRVCPVILSAIIIAPFVIRCKGLLLFLQDLFGVHCISVYR